LNVRPQRPKIFEGIRVTHCPACDQPVDNRPRISGHCFLCGQLTPDDNAGAEAATRRIQFERDQIKAEIAEADELLEAASNEQARVREELAGVDGELRQLEATLRPFQVTASSIVPEELALIDQRIGSLNARREAVNRLRGPLEARNKLTADIDNLADAIRRLQGAVAAREEKIELEAASDRLADGFNTYLNALRDRDPTTWTPTNRVRVRVSERRTQYFIGDGSAKSRLGGTLTIYFLFAYHYALLRLSRYSDCHYPGLTVLDFFADIAKTDSIGERLGLVLEPFIELAQQVEIPLQLITAARDFPRRTDIQFIELDETWV
jgi:hypothetical protein